MGEGYGTAGAPQGRTKRYFTTREIVVVALVAVLVVVTKSVTRMPLHLPGRSGLIWMALLLVGKGIIKRPGSGLAMGLVSGILAIAFGLGHEGPLIALKYIAPGIVFDIATPLLGGRLTSVVVGGIIGALANLSKLVSDVVGVVLLGMPMGFATLGLGGAAVTHVLFGAVGGVIGAVVLARLARHGIAAAPEPAGE